MGKQLSIFPKFSAELEYERSAFRKFKHDYDGYVQDFLNRNPLFRRLPIPFYDIYEYLDIPIAPFPFKKNLTSSTILGFPQYEPDEEKLFLYIQRNQPTPVENATLSHELYHLLTESFNDEYAHLLSTHLRKKMSSFDVKFAVEYARKEDDADKFGNKFSVPSFMLRQKVPRWNYLPQLNKLTFAFGHSYWTLANALAYLYKKRLFFAVAFTNKGFNQCCISESARNNFALEQYLENQRLQRHDILFSSAYQAFEDKLSSSRAKSTNHNFVQIGGLSYLANYYYSKKGFFLTRDGSAKIIGLYLREN